MKYDTSKLPEKCCYKCHFLVPNNEHTINSYSNVGRDRLLRYLNGDESYEDHLYARCRRTIWIGKSSMDTTIKTDDKEWLWHQLSLDRVESCFFYPHIEGSRFEPIIVLERREADRLEAEKDRKLTRKAFWVSTLALGLSILATIGSLGWNIWAHFNPLENPPTSAAAVQQSAVGGGQLTGEADGDMAAEAGKR